MIVPVRWCKSPGNGVWDIGNSEKHLEQPRFSGLGSKFINDLMEIYHLHLPFSVNRSGSLFDYTAKADDPCLEAASFNITDVLVGLGSIYPSNIELDKVYPYQIFTEDNAVIVTAYNLTSNPDTTDIARDCLKIFDTTTWIVIIAYLILFGIILDFNTILIRRRIHPSLSSCFEMFCHFMQKGQNEVHGWSRKILLLILAIFSFYILNYLSNYIKTESSVPRKPSTINNYRDLLDVKPKLDIYSSEAVVVLVELNEAREGTDAAQLAKGISRTSNIKTFSRLKRNEVAFIINKILTEFAISTYVRSFLADEEGQDTKKIPFRLWRSSDPSAKTVLLGSFMRTEFMRTNPFGKIISKRVKTIYETGITSRLISIHDRGIDLTGRNPPYSFIREMTRKDLVILEVEETPQIHFAMMTGLFKAFLFICLITMLIHLSELYARPITVHRLSQCNSTNICCRQMRQKNDQRMITYKFAPILVKRSQNIDYMT